MRWFRRGKGWESLPWHVHTVQQKSKLPKYRGTKRLSLKNLQQYNDFIMFLRCLQYITQEMFDVEVSHSRHSYKLLVKWWKQKRSIRVLWLGHSVNVNITEPLMNPPKASASNLSENLNDFWLANSGCWRDCRALGPVGWMWAMVSQWGRHPVTLHWTNPPDQSAVCQAGIKVRLHRSLPRPLYYLGALECSIDELESGK